MTGVYHRDITDRNRTFEALKDLTVGRTLNKGTLQVVRTGTDVRLECINHHRFSLGRGKEKVEGQARRTWKKVSADDLRSGFSGDFLRCQTDVERYKGFTFNGKTPPKGREGDELDRTGDFAAIENAGLQRLMKETIVNPKIRAFVTSLCGLQGISGCLTAVGMEADLGFGPIGLALLDPKKKKGIHMTGVSSPSSLRYDLSADNNVLLFRQSMNATPDLMYILGFKFDPKEQVSLMTKNEFSITMKIPLDQSNEGSDAPTFTIDTVERIDEDGNRVVFNPETQAFEDSGASRE